MWILPDNHPLYSAFAQECLASKEDLSAQSGMFEQSLMWRSKPLSLKIWLGKWSNVYWLPHLFGRMLKPSSPLQDDFVERWISSLEDTHASRFLTLDNNREQPTQDISSHTLEGERTQSLGQYDLFAASSRTSATTLISDTGKSDLVWNHLITRLKKEYSQRRKSALRIFASASSSWPTPTVHGNNNRSELSSKAGDGLTTAVKNWPTPTTSNGGNNNGSVSVKEGHGTNLIGAVHLWTTPSSRDYKDTPGMTAQREDNEELFTENFCGNDRLDQLPRQVFHWDKDTNSGVGKSRACLNPAWVLQLMGYNYREDLLRMAGNAVVEQVAELAFRTLVSQL